MTTFAVTFTAADAAYHVFADPHGWLEIHAATQTEAHQIAARWLALYYHNLIPLDRLDLAQHPAGCLGSATRSSIIWRNQRLRQEAAAR